MLIAWKYRERDTIIQRLDPRARIIFMLAMLFSVIQFWDLRITLWFLALALAQYFLTKLTCLTKSCETLLGTKLTRLLS